MMVELIGAETEIIALGLGSVAAGIRAAALLTIGNRAFLKGGLAGFGRVGRQKARQRRLGFLWLVLSFFLQAGAAYIAYFE